MKRLSKGDLVYVPSGATLFTNDKDGTVRKIMKLSQPVNLLITQLEETNYEVLYEGEKWLIEQRKTYEVLE